jgi:hypothetical protein
LEIRWSCRIVATTTDKAQNFFDRRGSLTVSDTFRKARGESDSEIAKSNKVDELINSIKAQGYVQVVTVSVESTTGSESEDNAGYIKEIFVMARKP